MGLLERLGFKSEPKYAEELHLYTVRDKNYVHLKINANIEMTTLNDYGVFLAYSPQPIKQMFKQNNIHDITITDIVSSLDYDVEKKTLLYGSDKNVVYKVKRNVENNPGRVESF